MSQQQNLNKFAYEFKDNRSVNQYQFCGELNINKDNTLLLAQSKAQTKVYVFKMEFLKLLVVLDGYQGNRRFLKKEKNFLSGSNDILVWTTYLFANPKYIQKIKTLQESIIALILHPTIENQFISASSNLIQFFQYSNNKQWFRLYSITGFTSVFGISINQNGTKIITCGENHLIHVFQCQQSSLQQNNNQSWLLIQKIIVKQWGFRVCFLNNDTFVFQPASQNYNGTRCLNIYNLINRINSQKKKTIPIKGGGQLCMHGFSTLYNQSKQILLMKNGYYINLFKYTEGQFKLRYKQAISFGITELFGTLSDDGQYLITWDKKSRQIQIRIYTEQTTIRISK